VKIASFGQMATLQIIQIKYGVA